MSRRNIPIPPAGRYFFDAAAANRVCTFFEGFLKHSKGEWSGQSFLLARWQRTILRDVFGTKHLADGTRRYRKVYIEVPRKNGKSTMAAGVGLYLTFADGEPGAEVYSAAADKPQARIVWTEAKRMLEASEDLLALAEVYTGVLLDPNTASSYLPISADARRKHGLNAHGVIYDELHAADSRELYDVLSTSMGARRQPLLWMMTTAGRDRTSLCWEMHEHARRVISGEVVDESFYGVIFGAAEGDDWTKPETWQKANPNYGVALKPDYLAAQCREAQQMPGKELAFRQLHLNQWVQSDHRWMRMSKWDACNGKVDLKKLAGRKAWVGLDLSRRIDVTAAVAVIPDGKKFILVPRFWIPEDRIVEKERTDRIPVREWVKRGFLHATPGDVIDYEHIRDEMLRWAGFFEIQEIGYDPSGATQLALQLKDDGLEVIEIVQTMKNMSEPTKALEALVLQRRICHGGHPVLRWMASNVVEYRNANDDVKLLKHRSAGRIDGVVAAIMGLARATLNPEFKSVYEQRGAEVIG